MFGRYFHDSSMSLKLTDIMFNLDFIAANCGSTKAVGGNIFAYETITSSTSGEIELSAAPVPVVTNGTAYVWYRKSSENVDYAKKTLKTGETKKVDGLEVSTEYCVMYRKAVDGELVTINAQFIPDTVHAVLTVALYSGDACAVESATKAGEVVIDIPRLQLSGAMDITMSATGASSTPLEGNALSSGCTSCDGQGAYATITKFISSENWWDSAEGLVIDDFSGIKAGDAVNKELVVYAYYKDKAPKKVNLDETYDVSGTATNVFTITFTAGATGLAYNSTTHIISGTAAAGTASVDIVCAPKSAINTNKNIVVSA